MLTCYNWKILIQVIHIYKVYEYMNQTICASWLKKKYKKEINKNNSLRNYLGKVKIIANFNLS